LGRAIGSTSCHLYPSRGLVVVGCRWISVFRMFGIEMVFSFQLIGRNCEGQFLNSKNGKKNINLLNFKNDK
jgi:hypothetical protein